MRSVFRNRILLLVLATLVILSLVLFSSLPGSPLSALTTPVSVLFQPVQKLVLDGWNEISGFTRSVFEGESIRKENEALRNQVASLQKDVQRLEADGRRWEELKSAFGIREAFSDYDIVGCQVMTRAVGPWFDLFRVDAGTRDGIVVTETTSYPVVDPSMNLVGRIHSTDLVSAKVLPLIHQGSVVDGRLQGPGGFPVRVRGDIVLRSEGLCMVDRIPRDASLRAGDVIETSGDGGLYPAGIPIGTIVSVQDADTGSERTATLRPFVEIDHLTYLFIMKGKGP
jgi:rod shape-determining protein MreC